MNLRTLSQKKKEWTCRSATRSIVSSWPPVISALKTCLRNGEEAIPFWSSPLLMRKQVRILELGNSCSVILFKWAVVTPEFPSGLAETRKLSQMLFSMFYRKAWGHTFHTLSHWFQGQPECADKRNTSIIKKFEGGSPTLPPFQYVHSPKPFSPFFHHLPRQSRHILFVPLGLLVSPRSCLGLGIIVRETIAQSGSLTVRFRDFGDPKATDTMGSTRLPEARGSQWSKQLAKLDWQWGVWVVKII